MSIIFGVRKSIGASVTRQELLGLAAATQAFAPDGTHVAAVNHIGMGFQPFHTTSASRQDSQPAVDLHRNALVFDGRLDNRSALLAALDIPDAHAGTSSVILAGFDRWGESVFARLVGDWTLALWWERTQTLYLARDHAGSRTLYFQHTGRELRWSTYLETFFAEGMQPAIDEEYIAAFLCGSPLRDLTPYRSIRAVPPSHYVAVRGERSVTRRHWQSLVYNEIRYQSDIEYEEHFFTLFQQSVARRSAVGDPVLAQLSGGMDSTSIVRMSDHIRRSAGYSTADSLDTISYFSSSEPNWDEEPFVTATEAQRGKTGIHLETSASERMADPPPPHLGNLLFPGITASVVDFQERFESSLGNRPYRAILSGIGGDEVLGGVPTPGPELANYLCQLQLSRLFHQGLAWSIALRNPMLHLMLGTARFAADLYVPQVRSKPSMPPWIVPWVQRLGKRRDGTGVSLAARLHTTPSALSNARTWAAILESLPNHWPAPGIRYEYRYPYMDRDLVDFLFRVPREQITRPGRRRSLMRRALRQLLPVEVLERRRKAFISRGPLVAIRNARPKIELLLEKPVLAECGWIDASALRCSANAVLNGKETKGWSHIMRAVALELWLQNRCGDLCIGRRSHVQSQDLFGRLEHPSSVQGRIVAQST